MIRRRPLAAALAALVLCVVPEARAASEARFHLSWNAPFGSPRAREALTVACGDSTLRDTLYVCFDPGPDSTLLIAAEADLRVWPARGDTLEHHWMFESRSNPASLRAQFNLEDVPGALPIWNPGGAGGVASRTREDGTHWKLGWAVRPMDGVVVPGGRIYAFARLLIPRPRERAVCAHPLCIEIMYGLLGHATGPGGGEAVYRGQRWASWNPGSESPCADRREKGRVSPWLPADPKRK